MRILMKLCVMHLVQRRPSAHKLQLRTAGLEQADLKDTIYNHALACCKIIS